MHGATIKMTKAVSEGINLLKNAKTSYQKKIKIMGKQFHCVSRFHGMTTLCNESIPTKKPRSPTQMILKDQQHRQNMRSSWSL
jgi:hypothetical protein